MVQQLSCLSHPSCCLAWRRDFRISKKIGDYHSPYAEPKESDEKSISVTLRYCSESEQSQFKEIGEGHALKKSDGVYAIDIAHLQRMSFDDIYKSYKRAISSEGDWVCGIQDQINLHFPSYDISGLYWIKIVRFYKHSEIILIASDQDRNEAQKILHMYKTIMQKIAQEDSSVTYMKTDYMAGKPWIKPCYIDEIREIVAKSNEKQKKMSASFLTKLKNFVVNEKFLYAMAGLSALYFGYEYMNQ